MPDRGSTAKELFSDFVQVGAIVQDIDQSMKGSL
jgi:hypothetical protein